MEGTDATVPLEWRLSDGKIGCAWRFRQISQRILGTVLLRHQIGRPDHDIADRYRATIDVEIIAQGESAPLLFPILYPCRLSVVSDRRCLTSDDSSCDYRADDGAIGDSSSETYPLFGEFPHRYPVRLLAVRTCYRVGDSL